MYRTLPALIILTLVACSSSSGGTGSSNGPGGSNGGLTNGTTSAGATGSASAGTSSGGAQGTTTGDNGPLTVDNFNARFNEAACTFVGSCEMGGTFAPYYLSASCSVGGGGILDLRDLPLAVDAGRVFFDPAQAAACLAGLNSGNCSIVPILPCIPFLSGANGLVPPAGPCYANGDCLSGACIGNDLSSCTTGTCSGLVASGGSCDCTNCGVCDADAGLTCVTSSDTCATASGVGQGCGSSDPACESDLACADDVCAAVPIPAGNACIQSSGECVSGDYCFQKGDAGFGNCATLLAAGQPCGEDADHQPNVFAQIDNECAGAHPVCLGAGTLVDSGVQPGTCSQFSNIGGSCTAPNAAIDTNQPYNDGCYQKLNCVAGACQRPPSSGNCSADGIPCDPTQSYCVGATTKCAPFIALGGTCTGSDNGECGPTASCNSNNVCQGATPGCSPTL